MATYSRRNTLITVSILVCLLSLNFISALGVSSPYWYGNSLKMLPGETKTVPFTIVTRDEGKTEQATVTILNDGGIAELTSGTTYTVAPKSTDAQIIFKISVPESASAGDSYDIEFEIRSASSDEGQIEVNMGYRVGFPVEVISPPKIPVTELPEEKANIGLIIGIIIAIVVILIIVVILLKKRKK